MAIIRSTLNHGGNDADNPILEGMTLQVKLHKNSAQSLRQAWVQVGATVHYDLTSVAVETDTEVTINLTAGTELQAGAPAVRNVIHFTTTDHNHVKQVVYVATQPSALITLDGYNADDPVSPFIWPIYVDGS